MKIVEPTVEESDAFARRVIAGLPDSLSERRNDLQVLLALLPAACVCRRIAKEMLVAIHLHERAQREFCFQKDAAYQISPGKPRVKYPGIVSDAQRLGVHRIHLYLVLTGSRNSQSLMRRYRKLKRGSELSRQSAKEGA